MYKRIVIAALFSLVIFAVLQGRLMQLSTNSKYQNEQKNKSEFILTLSNSRGNIYDCNFFQLTGVEKVPFALISPGEKNYKQLFDSVAAGSKNGFYKSTEKFMPFLVEIKPSSAQNAENIYYSNKRYMTLPIATHLIGYLDNNKNGVSGVEYAFDSVLKNAEPIYSIKAVTNARGEIISTVSPELLSQQGTGNGVMLCIDSRIQRICEAVALDKVDKGSIIVMDVSTGRVKACVSMPTFNPSYTAQSLDAEGAPFINRAISQFTAGSVFKPLLAAVALENGISKEMVYECDGSIDVNGHIYKCAYGRGHGEVNMEKALCESCNCYFVNLANLLGAKEIYDYSFAAGFGESTIFAKNILTAKGNLPSIETLTDAGELANMSFGQGKLTVTPAQITSFINIFANNGVYISPTFVEGIANKSLNSVVESLYAPMQRKVFSESTANIISSMLNEVVNKGLAVKAKPITSSAAGKTGTAQTGRLSENGDEYMDAWFSGYFPAKNPKYTITVLLDSGLHNSDDACLVFADVANAINLLTGNIDN